MEDLETNQTNRLIIVVSTNAYIKHPPMIVYLFLLIRLYHAYIRAMSVRSVMYVIIA